MYISYCESEMLGNSPARCPPARKRRRDVFNLYNNDNNKRFASINDPVSSNEENCFFLLDKPLTQLLQELQDQITDLQERKRAHTLAQKRSFFVRMVSDPKIYNPSVAKAMPCTRRVLTEATLSPEGVSSAELPV